MKRAITVIFLSLFTVIFLCAQGSNDIGSAGEEPEFREIHSVYRQSAKNGGSIERVDYSIDYHGITYDKHAYVYVPYGYKDSGERKYNIFYLMHGGSGRAETFFGGPGQSSSLKKLLDQMIAQGDIEPMIVVTPSYYNPGSSDDALLVSEFHSELSDRLIPAVESRYRTFNSRDHRAFGGFSMGSVTTWYTFINNLAEFRYFMPMSIDSWVIETMGGISDAEETAEALARVPASLGYSPKDFYIFAATGTDDMAYANETAQIEAMKKLTDVFIYGSDPDTSNLYYMVAEGGRHTYAAMNDYIYNALPYFFEEGNE